MSHRLRLMLQSAASLVFMALTAGPAARGQAGRGVPWCLFVARGCVARSCVVAGHTENMGGQRRLEGHLSMTGVLRGARRVEGAVRRVCERGKRAKRVESQYNRHRLRVLMTTTRRRIHNELHDKTHILAAATVPVPSLRIVIIVASLVCHN